MTPEESRERGLVALVRTYFAERYQIRIHTMQQSPSAYLERYYHEAGHAIVAIACAFPVGLIHARDGYVEVTFPFERFSLHRAYAQDPPYTYIDVLHTLAVLLAGNLALGMGLDPAMPTR